jgi:sugar diacid utilization regulator
MDSTPVGAADPSGPLRAQISNLLSLFALSTMLFDRQDEHEILGLVLTSVQSLCSCEAVAGLLARGTEVIPIFLGPLGRSPDLVAQVEALDGLDGQVALEECPWAWAYALSGLGGRAGYLVVAAAAEPPQDDRFLMKVLAQQAGAALASARLCASVRQHSLDVDSLNRQLTATVSELQWQTRSQEVIARVSSSGRGEEGIALAVHELTGLPVAVEDRFGNLRAWAGPRRPDPYPKADGRRRTQLLRRARSARSPVRDRGRLVALAQSRGDVLGVLALEDPDDRAGARELFALENGAMALSIELNHLRTLAEMQLRMRRDLVDDLISGSAAGSAVVRAEALGHDLQRCHRVVVVQGSRPGVDAVARAVGRSAGERDMGSLLAQRSATVVLLAAGPERSLSPDQWGDFHRAVAGQLRSGSTSVGVGGVAQVPEDLSRSYGEAMQALAIRRGSRQPDGVTVFEHLGIYRVLATGSDHRDIEQYVREWLGELIDYDAAHRSHLVATLSEFCDCGGGYDRTAEALEIHRSTLRYRLQRIRDVMGRDINDVEIRFNLHVATRAWRVLEGLR